MATKKKRRAKHAGRTVVVDGTRYRLEPVKRLSVKALGAVKRRKRKARTPRSK